MMRAFIRTCLAVMGAQRFSIAGDASVWLHRTKGRIRRSYATRAPSKSRGRLAMRGLDTTARDIASLAGVSLAAIGYHFRTKDELLAYAAAEAIGDALGAWIDTTLRRNPPGSSPGETFAAFCAQLPEGFAGVRTQLLTSFEHITRLVRSGDAAATMGQALGENVRALTGILRDIHPQLAEHEVEGLAHFYSTVINGLSVIWLASPDSVPAHAQFRYAISALAEPPT